MEDKNEIVLLFPKLKTSLKKEAAENYRNKNYKKALELYNQLIKYNDLVNCYVSLNSNNLS